MKAFFRSGVVLASGLWLAVCTAAWSQAGAVYTVGVVPQFDQRKLFSIWKPIVDELALRSGLKLQLTAALTVPDFEKDLAAGKFDFVYANPYHILREAQGQGYIPLVRDKEPLRGIVVVRQDSPLKKPEDLQDKELAVPSFNALGASLLIRSDLANVFHVVPKVVNVKSHTSVYMNVATGATDAGGGVEKTLHEQPHSLQVQLRVLYTTREMPSHPIAAHPRVTVEVRGLLQKAVLDLAQTGPGQRLLQEVPMKEAIPTSMKDYQPMLKWGLDAYWVN